MRLIKKVWTTTKNPYKYNLDYIDYINFLKDFCMIKDIEFEEKEKNNEK